MLDAARVGVVSLPCYVDVLSCYVDVLSCCVDVLSCCIDVLNLQTSCKTPSYEPRRLSLYATLSRISAPNIKLDKSSSSQTRPATVSNATLRNILQTMGCWSIVEDNEEEPTKSEGEEIMPTKKGRKAQIPRPLEICLHSRNY